MEKEDALKFWDSLFGNKKWAIDCYGTWICREDYGDTTTLRTGSDGKRYNYGWEIDHIRPKSSYKNENDADFYNNYEPVHWENNREKSNNYPEFYIDSKKYKVVRCSLCNEAGYKGYGIVDANGRRVDWKGVMQKYYKSNC